MEELTQVCLLEWQRRRA